MGDPGKLGQLASTSSDMLKARLEMCRSDDEQISDPYAAKK